MPSRRLQGLRFVRMDYEPNAIDPVLEARYEAGEWGTIRKHLNRLRRGKPMAWELEADKGKKAEKMAEEELDMAKAMEEVTRPGTQAIASPSSARPQEHDFPALEPSASFPSSSRSNHPKAIVRVWHSVSSFIGSFCTPVTLALFGALIIALVPNLKTLFVYTAEASYHPTAPGGQEPPLAVIYQTASFVGGASVPLGLVVLGGSIAKMEIPRPINRLPLASIASMAGIKLVLLPIIGFFFVQGLVKHTRLVGEDNHVLRLSECSSAIHLIASANPLSLFSALIVSPALCNALSSPSRLTSLWLLRALTSPPSKVLQLCPNG